MNFEWSNLSLHMRVELTHELKSLRAKMPKLGYLKKGVFILKLRNYAEYPTFALKTATSLLADFSSMVGWPAL